MEALMILGAIVCVVGNIMILVAAFREGILWGLASLIVPLVILIFVVTHWAESKKGFLIVLAGAALMGLGAAFSQGAAVEP